MPVTRNPSSGVPLYHYTQKVIKENRENKDRPLNRHERRKQKRKFDKVAKKFSGYVEEC